MLQRFCILPTMALRLLFFAYVVLATPVLLNLIDNVTLRDTEWNYRFYFYTLFDGSVPSTGIGGSGASINKCDIRLSRADWLSFDGNNVFGFAGYRTPNCTGKPIFELREATSFFSPPKNWESTRILPPKGYQLGY